MSAAELLRRLRTLGVGLRVEGSELKVSAPKGVLTPELQEQLRGHKAELTELLLIASSSAQQERDISIPAADRSKPIPLSFAQQRMWFLEELEGGSSVYNIPWAMRLKGALDKPSLQAALDDLVARHESLRSVFLKTDAEPVQQVRDAMPLQVEEIALRDADEEALQQQLEAWSQENFDLETGPLLKVRLIELGDNDHVLMMAIHHIISDAWSLDVLQTEFFSSYLARCSGQPVQFDDLPLQFADYAVWQRDFLSGDELENQLGYWTQKLRGAPPLLELPTDHPRPPEQSYRGARQRRLLSPALRDELQALAQQHNATLFMVLLAGFNVLLSRYSGQDDIVVGTPIAGRQQTELESLIGLFLNTLALRTELNEGQSFNDLLSQVQTTALDAYAHQELPFDKLVDALQPSRDMSHSPVFQVQFMLQNAPASGEPLAGLEILPVEFEYGTAKFDLTLATGETPDGLMAEIEYATDLFDEVTIERMLGHYERLLSAIVKDPGQRIGELPLAGPDELAKLEHWNDTRVEYPADATLQSLFEAQVAETPDAPALFFADEVLTYSQLNERANRLAHWLRSQDVGADHMVGVYMERSVEMVVALYGIIKAGCAYVPLDPDYPEQRIVHMFEDADMRLLLTQSHLAAQLPQHSLTALELDKADLASQQTGNPEAVAGPDNLAYAIFTSGSTGRPKGVMNEHHGIVNRLLWMQSEYQLDANDRVLQKTPFSFDVSVWEFFWPLMTGSALVVAKPGGHKDSQYLVEIIRQHRVTTMHFVPSMLQVFLQDDKASACESLKRVICSGEALSHDLQSRFFASFATTELHNLYGPTEAAIDVTYWACQRNSTDTSVPIGRPVDNTQIYVVEPNGRQAPIGVAGELWIGGEQVARGYANRPDLTAERFIDDPFRQESGARVYRTGDLVRWRNDGVIEFLGRIDHQVKLRGFRIELGEIEATLDGLPQVEQSLVMLREDVPGNKRLVAYLTGRDGAEPEVPPLRDALKDALPEYMVPAAFVPLSAFPLLSNGKVDRKALPEPEGKRDVTDEYIAPRSAVEQTLADIWKALLRVEEVGINDNFFEMGGDSILSIQIIARAAKAGLHLTPRQVFRHQTIAELAEVATTAGASTAEQGLVSGTVLLIPVQHWFFAQSSVDVHHFNQSTLLESTDSLNQAVLEPVFQALLSHHDALRLQFTEQDGNWSQVLAAPGEHTIVRGEDLSSLSEDEQDERMYALASEVQASFDLAAGCLIKAIAFDLGERNSRLLIVVHHLAVDGVSWRVLLEDLETLYAAASEGGKAELPPKSQSFLNWAKQLHDYAESDELQNEAAYWQSLPWEKVSSLPKDHDGENTVATLQTVTTALDEDLTRQLLQKAPQAYRTQINDLLLAALAKVIAAWTDGAAVQIDTEGHGREDVIDLDVSRTVGWFTTIYPVVLQVAAANDTSALIKSVKEQLRALPVNGLGYGLLRYMNETDTALESIPQGDILFNYLGQFDQSFNDDIAFRPVAGVSGPDQSPERPRSHVLDINGSVFEGRLQFGFSFSNRLHDEATVQRIADQFIAELKTIIWHCVTAENTGLTPSDFPLVSVEQAELDELLKAHPDTEELYPITPMQHGMLFHSLFMDEGADDTNQVYLTQVIWSLEGELDADAFNQAWQEIVNRHVSLRSSFHVAEVTEPLAIVHSDVPVHMQTEDWSRLEAQEQETQLDNWLRQDQQRGYELTSAPLMRLFLARVGEQSYRFVWSHHHIIMDGWSIPVVLDELFAVYNAITGKRVPELSPPRSYGEYIAWLQQQDRAEAEAFWRDTLAGFMAPTPLPAATATFKGIDAQSNFEKCFASLNEAETSALRELAKSLRLTANTLVQGVWALLISRYTGEDDVVFGATTSGRPAELKGVESIVGLFLNAIPVRAVIDTEATVQNWLQGIQEQQLAARQHEYASLVDVQGWSDVPRGQALFNSVLIFENYPDASSLWSDRNALRVTDMQSRGWTSLPLAAAASISSQFVLRLSYDTSCYSAVAIEELVSQFLWMLRKLINQTDLRVGDLLQSATELIPAGQAEPVPDHAYEAFPALAENETLVSRFESMVQRYPEAPAVEVAGATHSYGEINNRANAVAHALIDAGLAPGDRVGLLLGQDDRMPAGMLGALKAGLTYVPLDPKAPLNRLAAIVSDAGLTHVITDVQRERVAADLQLNFVSVDEQGQQATGPNIKCAPDSLAYILFTSGSTGTPKGVMQTHRNVLQHVRNYSNEMHISCDDRLSLFAPYGFDAAVMDIYGALLNGACLCPFDIREQMSADAIRNDLIERRVSVYHSTPTVYRFLFADCHESFAGIRLVVLGGEQARLPDLEIFRNRFTVGARFCNLMGATEFSLASVFFAVHDTLVIGTDLPLGRAVEGVELLLLDESGQPTTLHGELCVRSDYATPGYWNDEALTSAAFMPGEGAPVYRMGDICRYTPGGQLVFMGRRDEQLKVRGNRVEPGEVEAVVNSATEIERSAVVVTSLTSGEEVLAVYFVTVAGQQVDPSELRRHLQQQLPDYMIPGAYVELAEIPLTANGKLDRRALPQPDQQTDATEYVAPQTETETKLTELWAEVLGVERVGVRDDFFVLGGHSLLATKLIARIRDDLGYEPGLRLLFAHPTVAEFAAELEQSDSPLQAVVPVPHAEGAPLSFAQQRLWFLDQLEGDNPAYHMFAPVRMQGSVNLSALEAAGNDLVARHESLRTIFIEQNDEQLQMVLPQLEVPLQVIEMPGATDQAIGDQLAQLVQEPYQLDQGPLFKLRMLKLAEDEYIFVILIHHIISDVWSMEVMYRDLLTLYRQHCGLNTQPLPELPVQYPDFAIWQREMLESVDSDKQLEYWRNRLDGVPAVIDLPLDRPRPQLRSSEGGAVTRLLSAEVNDALKDLARQQGVTLFILLQAVFKVLLARYSGQNDVVVGTPITGRKHSEVEGLIGFFLNMLVLRSDLSANPSFSEFLQQVKTHTLDAYANQDLPFEMLVDELKPERDLSHTPLFQVAFTVVTPSVSPGDFPDLHLEPVEADFRTAKFDLFLSMTSQTNGLNVHLEYSSVIFDRATIERMLDHLVVLLDSVIAQPYERVAELSLLPETEREQVVSDWNKTSSDYPADSGIHTVFEQQVAATPKNVALICEGAELTYAELNSRVNRLTHYLISAGVQPEDNVALCMDRSIDAVVAILAILKAGGAYVPLDPAYPEDRRNFMLEDCEASIMLADSDIEFELTTDQCRRINLDQEDFSGMPDSDPDVGVNGQNLAYIIYTSGSTGRPKGTLIEQRSVLRLVVNNHFTRLDTDTRIAMMAPISFDASTLEIWGSLLNGGTSVIYPERTPDLARLRQFFEANRIDLCWITSSLFNTIIDTDPGMLDNVTTVMSGGEALSVSHVTRAYEVLPNINLINGYGPTESTTFTTTYPIPRDLTGVSSMPIGKPIANTTVYIVDEFMQPVPVGITGELCIGGDGLSRGYLNQPELTQEKFIPNTVDNQSGERLYRTGDLVRYRADGNIEFIGRVDDQVKIRGFRIELGEIEYQLRDHEAVDDAAVIVHEAGANDKRLVAYAAVGSNQTDDGVLLDFLKDRLPRYMVPSIVMQVTVIPKTANGKVDRKALPDPVWSSGGGEELANEAEIQLASLWKQLLKVEAVGRTDNFFDLGGHSLLTIRLAKEIEKATGRKLTIADVFDNPTLAELSQVLADEEWDTDAMTIGSEGFLGRIRSAVSRLIGRA